MQTRNLILLLAICGIPLSPVGAWGNDGHRIIGEIAWSEMAPRTRAGLESLLVLDGYPTLAQTCTWADTYARRFERYDWLRPYHYMNGDPRADGLDLVRDCPTGRCVLGGITRWAAQLRAADAGVEERSFALAMLTHLVGDIHQPLHVAHPDGRGGNNTFPVFFGEVRNLHWVWDVGILRRSWPSKNRTDRRSKWTSAAASLRDSIDPQDRTSWRRNLDPLSWGNESLDQAKRHAFDVEQGEPLGEDYVRTTAPVVERRLQMAGVRLAALLDTLLAEHDDSP